MFEDLMMLTPTFFDDSITTLAKSFLGELQEPEDSPCFVEENDEYVMQIPLDGRELGDFSVSVKDDAVLKVAYFHQNDNSSSAYEMQELLPYDADANEITAEEAGNNILIKVSKKHA